MSSKLLKCASFALMAAVSIGAIGSVIPQASASPGTLSVTVKLVCLVKEPSDFITSTANVQIYDASSGSPLAQETYFCRDTLDSGSATRMTQTLTTQTTTTCSDPHSCVFVVNFGCDDGQGDSYSYPSGQTTLTQDIGTKGQVLKCADGDGDKGSVKVTSSKFTP